MPLTVSARLMASLRGPTATTTFTNMLILGSNAIGGIVSARALGPTGRGQLIVVMLWASLINVLGLLGLPSACTYYVARWPHRRAALGSFFIRTALWQAIAASIVSGVFLWWLHLRLHLPALLTIEYMSWAAGSGIALYGTSIAQGMANFRDVNRIRIIGLAAPAVPIVGLVLIVKLTPAEAGAAYVIPVWLSAAIGYRLLRRNCGSRDTAALTRAERHEVFSYARRNFSSVSNVSLNSNADQIIIGMLLPVGALGLYSVASSASSPVPSFVTSISMVGLPTIAALTGPAKVKATWRTLRRALLPLAVVAPACAVALPWVIPALYGKNFASAVVPAELLLAGTVLAALTIVTDDLLRAHACPGFVSITQGAGAAVTIAGTLVAARHSLDAVAVASSLGYAVAFVLAITRLWSITWLVDHRRVARAKAGRHQDGSRGGSDVLSLCVTSMYLRVRRYAGSTSVTAPDLRLVVSTLLAACALILVTLALNQVRPGPAIVMGSVSLALYCLALLLLSAVSARWPGMGLAACKIGAWSVLWVAVTFGLATITWAGPQSGDATQIEISNVFRALWLIAAAMTAFTCGYCIGPRATAERHLTRLMAAQRRRFSDNIRSPWVPWVLFLAGTGMQIVLAASTGRFGYVGDAASATTTASGYEQFLAIATYLGPLSVAAAAARAYRNKGFHQKFTLVTLFIAEVAIGAAAGVKQSYVLAILAILLPRVAAGRRIPVGVVVAAAAVFMLVVIPFNQDYRSDARGSDTLSTSQAITAAPGILGKVLSNDVSPSVIGSSTIYVAQRIREIDSPAIIIQRTPGQIPYSSPLQLVVAPIADMIPRALWPGKPILAVGYAFSQQYFELPSSSYTATAITPEGDLYRHGGLIPVLAGMCLLGCAIRILDDLLDVRTSLHAAFFVIIAAPEVINSETDWITLLAGFPALVILWLLAIRISFQRNEVRAVEQSAKRPAERSAAG